MPAEQLSPGQRALVQAPLDVGQTVFLSGPAGAGKSSVLAARLVYLLEQDVPAYAILVLLPDRPTRERLRQALRDVPLGPYGDLSLHTYYSLAQRLVALFWPLVARQAGFAHPERPPTFMTYELAQYHLQRVVAPLLEEGYFEGLHLHPQRLLSQLLDNLNKAALNNYPLGEVAARLSESWIGPPERLTAFQQAQDCIERFRADCLQRGLLDLSLTLQVFQQLLERPPFWDYFGERYRHLLVDNLEESVPAMQDFCGRMLPYCESGLLVYNEAGGYRILLGAESEGALALRRACSVQRRLEAPPRPAERLAQVVAIRLGQESGALPDAGGALLGLIQRRYRSDVIQAVAGELARLVHREQVPPQEIAVVAPYLDGVLRFALGQACTRLEVPLHILRRYRRPAEEPAVRALLTLAALLQPSWRVFSHPYDVAEALGQALPQLDPVRAALLGYWVYDPVESTLRPPQELSEPARRRLGPTLQAYEQHFWPRWQQVQQADTLPWEHLLAHLLARLLDRAVQRPDVSVACGELIESARRFRRIFPLLHEDEAEREVGRHYLHMLQAGLVTAQYLLPQPEAPAVWVAPAHSYLLAGRPVRRQFWMDIGSVDWWEPPQQPLTNPYVLSRHWPPQQPWNDAADYARRQVTLTRVVRGLTRRCQEGIVLCHSDLGTAGQVQDGPLLRALQPALRAWEEAHNVPTP
ncbi:MAG: hypothetical protein JXA37_08385 [Chloroflexia bacterium]|nr:hypothetical protein [Chloroflexia bacterium]